MEKDANIPLSMLLKMLFIVHFYPLPIKVITVLTEQAYEAKARGPPAQDSVGLRIACCYPPFLSARRSAAPRRKAVSELYSVGTASRTVYWILEPLDLGLLFFEHGFAGGHSLNGLRHGELELLF